MSESPKTGAELLSALAKAQYESTWGYEDHTSWEALHPDTRAAISDVIRHTSWPLIVEAFAGWLEVQGDDCGSIELADMLRERFA